MSARAPYLPIWTTSRDGLPSYVEFTSDLHQTQGPEVFWCHHQLQGGAVCYECAAFEGNTAFLEVPPDSFFGKHG